MSRHATTPFSPKLSATCFALRGDYRPVVRQESVFVRFCALTVASVLALGRHTPTQLLVALGRES